MSWATKNKKNIINWALSFAFISIITIFLLLFFVFKAQIFEVKAGAVETDLLKLFENKAYSEVIAYGEDELKKGNLALEVIILTGYSYYYEGTNIATKSIQENFMDESIKWLKRALQFEDTISYQQTSQIYYVLGKVYFNKGNFFIEDTIYNFNKAISLGALQDDIHEYLGISYQILKNYKQTIEHLELALKYKEDRNKDLIYKALLGSYYQLYLEGTDEDYYSKKILTTITKALALSSDDNIRMDLLLLQGDYYKTTKDYLKAEESYQKVIAIDSIHTYALFKMGELFEEQGNLLKARDYWRKSASSDSSFLKASEKLKETREFIN